MLLESTVADVIGQPETDCLSNRSGIDPWAADPDNPSDDETAAAQALARKIFSWQELWWGDHYCHIERMVVRAWGRMGLSDGALVLFGVMIATASRRPDRAPTYAARAPRWGWAGAMGCTRQAAQKRMRELVGAGYVRLWPEATKSDPKDRRQAWQIDLAKARADAHEAYAAAGYPVVEADRRTARLPFGVTIYTQQPTQIATWWRLWSWGHDMDDYERLSWPSRGRMAALGGIHRRKVSARLASLEALGLIERIGDARTIPATAEHPKKYRSYGVRVFRLPHGRDVEAIAAAYLERLARGQAAQHLRKKRRANETAPSDPGANETAWGGANETAPHGANETAWGEANETAPQIQALSDSTSETQLKRADAPPPKPAKRRKTSPKPTSGQTEMRPAPNPAARDTPQRPQPPIDEKADRIARIRQQEAEAMSRLEPYFSTPDDAEQALRWCREWIYYHFRHPAQIDLLTWWGPDYSATRLIEMLLAFDGHEMSGTDRVRLTAIHRRIERATAFLSRMSLHEDPDEREQAARQPTTATLRAYEMLVHTVPPGVKTALWHRLTSGERCTVIRNGGAGRAGEFAGAGRREEYARLIRVLNAEGAWDWCLKAA